MRLTLFSFLLFLMVGGLQAQVFTIDTIGPSVLSRIEGKSYPKGCPVPLSDLRYLRLSHFDREGREHVGEMICNKRIAQDLTDIFRELYQARYPIERMRLIDEYDADDEQSMRDNNTSCFCYRVISGSTTLSNHALGMAVDVNPLYNPYHRGQIVQPANARKYCNRRGSFPYKIKQGDLLHRLFTAKGFRWGGSWKAYKDYQHFDKK